MLGLDQTALLLDALRPPAGMEIDAAVGTTFTLDLTALLAVPVAASFDDTGEREQADLLETIRRYADRTVLFCQAGAISVPPKYRAALTFVEQTVVEVKRPHGGIFHPKAWVVRFSGPAGPRHRVLIMSRNMTFDRAWDVIVRLDEDPKAEQPVAVEPLQAFLRRLPSMAARTVSKQQREILEGLIASLGAANLAVPQPFTDGELLAMWPGHTGAPFHGSCEHALAISPFLAGKVVGDFLRTAKNWSGVVSRRAALDGVADSLRSAQDVLRIKDVMLDAQASVEAAFDGSAPPDDGDAIQGDAPQMRGLHAKVFVQDLAGDTSSVWLGSANLTDGAFSRNVESMVRLSGPTSLVGYDTVLAQKRPRKPPERTNLRWLVEDHSLPETESDPESDDLSELEGHAYDLASRDFNLVAVPANDGWDLDLTISPWQDLPATQVRAALLTRTEDSLAVIDGTASWHALAQREVTPFVVVSLAAHGATRRILVRASLTEPDSAERRGAVLAQAIANRGDFLRYLGALLGVPFDNGAASGDGTGLFVGWAGGGLRADRVFEDLLTTAARNPERLASLDQTLKQLAKDASFSKIVPPEFNDLWAAVHAARGRQMS